MYFIKTLPRKNSKKYTKTVFESESKDEIKQFMKANDLQYTGTPYFFTCILLSNNHIITQEIRGLMTSPKELADELKANA